MRKIVKSIVVVSLMLLIVPGIAWSQDKDDSLLDKGDLDDIVNFFLPSIAEKYTLAKNLGIINEQWEELIGEITSQDYEDMGTPERALQVGKTLADISFLVLNMEEGEAPSEDLLEKAKEAIESLEPPDSLQSQVDKLLDGVKGGDLAGEELRNQADQLLRDVIVEMEKAERLDEATLISAGGFLRMMYLGASVVSTLDSPTQQQLAMFSEGYVIDYFIFYFAEREKTSADFKESVYVEDFIAILRGISELLKLEQGKIPTKQDIVNIAEILAVQFQ